MLEQTSEQLAKQIDRLYRKVGKAAWSMHQHDCYI